MAATYNFTVDNIGNPEPVVAQSDCEEITVYEDNQAGTTDYTVRSPFTTSPAVTRPAGTKTTFRSGRSGFIKGRIVAYLATASGSVTFAQEEA